MVPRPIVVSAPASAMLFGEHAVLRGASCIVAAIDCRLQLRLVPSPDHNVRVSSSLGNVATTLSELSFGASFRYIEASFRLYSGLLTSGCSVEIVSQINPTVGLGSSASVTVAILAALQYYIFGKVDQEELLCQSCLVIKEVQGFGSGADAASIIYGGVISYNARTRSVERLSNSLPLVLVYSGSKTPTSQVIKIVNEYEKLSPKYYEAIFSAIAENVVAAIPVIKEGNLPKLGVLMNQGQGLMQALGVNSLNMASIWLDLVQQPTMYGAKISGSGLGDCIVGLGALAFSVPGLVPSKVSHNGVLIDF